MDSVRYRIGERQLLTDVYLSCETGETVGLLGRNGSGKTTLLQIIFGTRPTVSKHIKINDQVYQAPYQQPDLLTYLPQQGFLPKDIPLNSVIDLYYREAQKRKTLKEDERIQPHLRKYAEELSKGERRYFELLLLLLSDAKFLLLDEPFSGVAPLHVEVIQELLMQYAATKGFIITDHDYHTVLKISDRLILLHEGSCKPISHAEELADWGYVPYGKL